MLGGVGDLIKVPPILADLAIGYLVYSMVLELGARRNLALGAALLAVLNPISWFDSVVWGQADAFGVVFMLLGLRELWRDRPERAAIYTVVAAIIKPQLGILVPLVAVVTIRRALWPAGGEGDPERTGRPIRILTTGLAGLGTVLALSIPFGLSPLGFLKQLTSTTGTYPYTTVNAYNPWSLIPSDQGGSPAATGGWICDAAATFVKDDCGWGSAMFGPIPAIVVGVALLAVAFAIVLFVAARRPGPPDAARLARRARPRVLHPADAGPRAIRLSVLPARGDPGGPVRALAGGLPRAERCDVREHVRGPRRRSTRTTR